jgi:clan AA aspartic protease (TIGR02281 family)
MIGVGFRSALAGVMALSIGTGVLADERIRMTEAGGVYSVPVQVNGALAIDFVLDTGASMVMIPADVALTLKRTGTVTAGDELGKTEYELADGSIVEHRRILLRSLQIGSRKLRDVEGIVGGVKSTLLLGQSALRQLEPWRLDTRSGQLIIMAAEAASGAGAVMAEPADPESLPRAASLTATSDSDCP